ncbi:MAG: YceD family protein [Bacillota bacterium]|jgi:uncharacterized protein|uniref:DUF177 domain-containing protein n=1 Tax=Thermanaerosceptrum fracticalcis TaxID=1712410 RepID=A0A7G6E1K0_THEFR|nr:DUF177 domain-containing protein [Thermanaerosceptrum fracticalcis]MBZ4655435.1 DNA-binding protein [Peptococcaceae bacterium]QNB45954.1 hypothetical protein BR63_06285 [Thermanaerosceptrum fracticalcis]
MKINVGDLRKHPGAEEQFEFVLQEVPAISEFSFVEPIKVKGKITNTGNVLELNVNLKTSALTTCSRCLDEVKVPVEITFAEEYCHASDCLQKQGLDDSAVIVFDSDFIDITEAVQENLILSLPMRTLCEPDCPGFCPQCGRNLKEGTCECHKDNVDPRLAVLAKLKK